MLVFTAKMHACKYALKILKIIINDFIAYTCDYLSYFGHRHVSSSMIRANLLETARHNYIEVAGICVSGVCVDGMVAEVLYYTTLTVAEILLYNVLLIHSTTTILSHATMT